MADVLGKLGFIVKNLKPDSRQDILQHGLINEVWKVLGGHVHDYFVSLNNLRILLLAIQNINMSP